MAAHAHLRMNSKLIVLLVLSLGYLVSRGVWGAESISSHEAPSNINSSASESTASARSLSALVQVIHQLEQYVAARDLGSIHSEDAILGICMKAMMQRLDAVTVAQRGQFKSDLAAFAQCVSDLHLAGDLGQQTRAENELKKVTDAFQKVKSHYPEPIVAAAEASTTFFSCPMHRDVVGSRTHFCPKCGMELDQLVRILPANVDTDSLWQAVRAIIKTQSPLAPGETCSAILRLERANGEPILVSDLIETHTKKIHLLIIDPSLTDYHHEHPVPTAVPGEYAFTFTPRKPGSYRAWADVRPYPFGLQEYATAEIVVATTPEPLRDRATSSRATVDGLSYDLVLTDAGLRVGVPATAKLRITTSDGKPFTQLEPVMATFAHIVAFNEDYKTVLHMHPKGLAVSDPNARGGPELEFQIYALKPGFYRLFAQVQIDGRSRFAPFGIQILR